MVGGQGRERNLIQDNNHPSNYPPEKNSRFIRFLTPREWARLLGFPDSFQIVVSDTQAYKQFGNSVAVPVVKAVARNVLLKVYGKPFLHVH
jgi:DNA (cytosine-5)-methyltransferase 1